MNVETVTRTIQLILAPVVMVTACAILLGSMQTRYGAINDRLRAMVRERLDLLQASLKDHVSGTPLTSAIAATALTSPEAFAAERLAEIDIQIPLLLAHHSLAQQAVLLVYFAVVVFLGDMFVIAFGFITTIDAFATLVLLMFLVGVGLLLAGAVFTALEVRTSHRALHYEVQRIAVLRRD